MGVLSNHLKILFDFRYRLLFRNFVRVRFRYRCKGKKDILNNKIKVEDIPLKRVNEQNGLKTPVVAIFTAEIGKVRE